MAGSGAEARPQQREHANTSEQSAQPAAQVERLAVWKRRFHQCDQDGNHGDDQRRITGGNFSLGPDEQDIIGGHEEYANECELPRSAARYAEADAAGHAKGVEDCSGDDRAHGSNQRWREMQAGEVNGSIGRAPEEVHTGEGDCDAGFL